MPETDPPGEAPRLRVHPLDLLFVVLAAAAAWAGYAFLFRDTPVARPGDRVVGSELLLEFRADRPWKREFAVPGRTLVVEDRLAADVLEVTTPPDGPADARRVRVRVRERDAQRPFAVTQLRKVLRRGVVLVLRDDRSEVEEESQVEAELLEIRRPPGVR